MHVLHIEKIHQGLLDQENILHWSHLQHFVIPNSLGYCAHLYPFPHVPLCHHLFVPTLPWPTLPHQ